MADRKSCAHPTCGCDARDGERYCSEHCSEATTLNPTETCTCGHATCHP